MRMQAGGWINTTCSVDFVSPPVSRKLLIEDLPIHKQHTSSLCFYCWRHVSFGMQRLVCESCGVVCHSSCLVMHDDPPSKMCQSHPVISISRSDDGLPPISPVRGKSKNNPVPFEKKWFCAMCQQEVFFYLFIIQSFCFVKKIPHSLRH